MMTIHVNGERRDIPAGSTVAALLRELGLADGVPGVAVAVNAGVVRRQEWDRVVLAAGDRIEVIRATQGG